jgi:phage shock protein A
MDQLKERLEIVLKEISQVMQERKDQVESIRDQITRLENDNEDLEKKISELVRDYI